MCNRRRLTTADHGTKLRPIHCLALRKFESPRSLVGRGSGERDDLNEGVSEAAKDMQRKQEDGPQRNATDASSGEVTSLCSMRQ